MSYSRSILQVALILLLPQLTDLQAAEKKKVRKSKTPSKTSASKLKINPSRPPPGPHPYQESTNPSEEKVLRASPAFTDLDLPTDNQMIFSKINPDLFFQPTFSKRTISAMFGCVRNPGSQNHFTRFHEGVDIRPMERREDGEPDDEVHSSGDGEVVHICKDRNASNYGKYIVIAHDLFGPRFYTLYAHLASIEDSLEIGSKIAKGQRIGILGRTSNEFHIDQEFAHLHFEVDLMANDRYCEYSQKNGEGTPNQGLFNGVNLIGIDPVRFFQFLQINPDLGIGDFIRREPVSFRLLIPKNKKISWLARYPFSLSKPISEETAALEISMTYYGLPVQITPKSREEITKGTWKALSSGIFPLTYASASQLTLCPCCKLVENHGNRWKLSDKGTRWIKSLIF